MIPLRVKLHGFLSYRNEQELRFDEAPVWMLSGANGSGKSAIFDALTYSLFGSHRGGSTNAVELIHKESNSLSVEFDFQLEGTVYRIKRTLRRPTKGSAASTQQLFVKASGDEWAAVPDTTKKIDFDKWIAAHVGLDYETFTSSVLLIQGKSEKLLDAKPGGRFEVLAGIVDLQRFQNLHDKANTRKLEAKAMLDTIGAQTEGVPTVTDEEFALAEFHIDNASDQREQATQRIGQLQQRESEARRWHEAEERRRSAEARLRQAEVVLGDAVRIENQYARVTELRTVLPVVHTVVTNRSQKKESIDKATRWQKERSDANERRSAAERTLEQAKRQKTLHQKDLKEQEDLLRVCTERLRTLAGVMQTVRLLEDQQSQVQRLRDDLDKLPTDPAKLLDEARNKEQQRQQLETILPNLEHFNTERHDLGQAIRKESESKVQRDDTATQGKEAKAKLDALTTQLDDVRKARGEADSSVAVAKAKQQQATQALADLGNLDGATECRACGQPLTAKHFAQEKAEREKAVKEAEKTVKEAAKTLKVQTELEQATLKEQATLTDEVAKLRDKYKDAEAATKQAAVDMVRLQKSLALRYASLPDAERSKISPKEPTDWTSTTYPDKTDLVALRRVATSLDAARRDVREAEATVQKVSDLKGRIDSLMSSINTLGKTVDQEDVASARGEQATLASQETTIANTIRGLKKTLETTERDIDLQQSAAHSALTLVTDLAGRLKSEDEKQVIYQETLTSALTRLPQVWQTSLTNAGLVDHSKWTSELDGLLSDGVEKRYKELEQARGGLATLRADVETFTGEAGAFPTDSQVSVADVQQQIQLAKTEETTANQTWIDAQKHRDKLSGYRETRAKLGEQYKQVDQDLARYKLLAELLGKDRLQRHLVRQAERQIVELANSMLDRLSGGQLFLQLVGGNDSDGQKALELECFNRTTGGAPINVQFLSGSQRFRVSVALALAIGQYASRQFRPIESVIIDEGFGCLDRSGRTVMIQELHNLRGHLKCIILVSHQEEFAEAFNDGYRFELSDGATKVARITK
jgi:DNA repair protein SbcC/Rad50